MADSDELVSQFLAFTGSADTNSAKSYLEMCGGDLQNAVGLYLEHQGGGGGGGGGGSGGSGGGASSGLGAGMDPSDVRAPDATRTMRLMDDGLHGQYMHHPMLEEAIQNSAFAPVFMDARNAVNAAAAAAAAQSSDDDDEEAKRAMDDDDDDDDDDDVDVVAVPQPNLANMFAPPDHLIFKEGGFEGARSMAKDNKRWLLVNLQRDSEFSCHALNRDVWRDELVENLIREGFIFWQSMDTAPEGQVYAQRYHVEDYPHVGIIDPRTRRLMWRKEGWTQENPMTAETFAEIATDFCSRHSFDKPPVAPRPGSGGAKSSRPTKRPIHERSEDEQLQAAMRASLEDLDDANNDDDDVVEMEDEDDDNDGEVEYLGTNGDDTKPPPEPEEEKKPSLLEELLAMPLGDAPATGARIQLRMPDGKRNVRKFVPTDSVKTLYAFVAQNNEEAKGGREFVLMSGFPPKDLITEIDSTIEACQLSGQAITVGWK